MKHSTPHARSSAGLPIVIADDNRDSADSLKMLLELDGHTIHVAHDGQQALELVERIRPRMALLDIGMPRLNGYEVAAKIRAKPWGRGIDSSPSPVGGSHRIGNAPLPQASTGILTKPVDYDAVRTLVLQAES